MLVCVFENGSNKFYVEYIHTDGIRCLVIYRHNHVWRSMDKVHAAIRKMEEYGVNLSHVKKSDHWDLMLMDHSGRRG